MRHRFKTMASPVGRLTLVSAGDALAAILWEHDRPARVPVDLTVRDDDDPVLVEAQRQLGDYFAGARSAFEIPLAFAGTPFQREVWHALLRIPFGQTRTYAQIACEIGRPGAVRAVGAANGRNPISIVAPCHRVVGSDGSLTGFAGGLDAKAFLLALESRAGPANGR